MKVVSINDMSDSLFLNTVQYREIGKARIISRQEKKTREDGGPDVEITSWANEKFYITRNQLMLNFFDVGGKALNVRAWKNNESHIIMCQANKLCGVVHVPKSRRYGVLSTTGKRYKPGVYVVCMRNPNGELNRKAYSALDAKLFHKMFKIDDSVEEMASRVRQEQHIKEIRSSGETVAKVKNPNGTTVTVDKELAAAKYTVVAKVIKLDTNKVVGYTVSYNGKQIDCSLAKIEKLCKEKKLKNMTVVYSAGSAPYFRCIGMTHESLGSKYIK